MLAGWVWLGIVPKSRFSAVIQMGVVGNCAKKQVQCSNTVLQGKKKMTNHRDNEKAWWTYLVSDEPTMMSELLGD